MKEFVLIAAHGSKNPKTPEEIRELSARLSTELRGIPVEIAYLEILKPDIAEGIERCVGHGAAKITVLPYFLNTGKHVEQDIPTLVDAARFKYPEVRIDLLPHVGAHPSMVQLCKDLLKG
ncbi:MAG: CbiX/SirB N-terminal domain-containing protein [Candidatus Omnitrophica bacterium]|nr:CbiX/SirB N-terminal domain-containing protein [Candidatus Omnitrophota bacterium]